jgi:hypothetical protein
LLNALPLQAAAGFYSKDSGHPQSRRGFAPLRARLTRSCGAFPCQPALVAAAFLSHRIAKRFT